MIDKAKVTIHVEAELKVWRRERALAKARVEQSELIEKMPLNADEVMLYAELTKADVMLDKSN